MMASEESNYEVYTLHMFPFSLYSIMVMYTYVLGRENEQRSATVIVLSRNLINLHRDENIKEDYLLNINPKGLVPALTVGSLSQPLSESLDISYWLCTHYRRLLPEVHESEIRRILTELHSIQGQCLSISKGRRMEKIPCDADEPLQRDDLSPEYRQALEYKQKVHRETLETALTSTRVTEAEDQAQRLFDTVTDLYNAGDYWVLGQTPTILDGHLVPFIVRLLDCQRHDLVPGVLQQYAERQAASSLWKQVMHGRPTMWNVSLGHVSDMAADYTEPL